MGGKKDVVKNTKKVTRPVKEKKVQDPTKSKRKRCSNFSDDDRARLVDLMTRKEFLIIDSKATGTTDNNNKKDGSTVTENCASFDNATNGTMKVL